MSCDDTSTIVVIGGGIAGISCVEGLFQDFDPSNCPYNNIVLISECQLIKRTRNYVTSGRQLETFDVAEENVQELISEKPEGLNFDYINGKVKHIDHSGKTIVYSCQTADACPVNELNSIPYNILCLCHGSKPRRLEYKNQGLNKELDGRIIVVRDTNTVLELRERLKNCQRIVIVGNGGISLELVSKIANCEKVWIIRDSTIGCTYFDSGAAKFFMDAVITDYGKRSRPLEAAETTAGNRLHFTGSSKESCSSFGPALGPNWSQDMEFEGIGCSHNLDIVYEDEVTDVIAINCGGDQEFPVRVFTRKGELFDCDMIVTAIGVVPNNLEVVGGAQSNRDSCSQHLKTSLSDGGILVDTQMRTSMAQIYAAGDVVSCEKWPTSELWFQMRLWTQARQMGHYAARCISAHLCGQDPSIYFTFDCFTHCTSFFGYKLVLLGKFNGQQVEKQFEIIARVEPKKEYVKILVSKDDGRIIGAVLVGDSGLEETIENLIHDQIDISHIKGQLLDNTVDIEDYFD